ncbi:TIGR04222 domain-containing membrane protein [Streptomyces sp. P9(2023)]|uniref:TIGR04222 domain-containing membrane protein n=1 Tax=Streptomyces sp. P9(2023) TaxID=3064394 RepID=UPI0028F4266F|nr:TIGR04222 domain-containing membrane protein [Streptomyces sp. P9(2023)]MDT9690132.1 TIGR04222 domain-containing membrane protein [Streptomyces sp. P9(2023)]
MNLFALLVWAAVITGSVLLIVRLRDARADRGGYVHDLPEAAFLIGGPPRVVDSALAALHADGRIAVGGPGIVVARPGAAPRDHVERAVLQELAAAPHGALHHLRLAVMRSPAVQEIGDGLAARGLMVDPAARRAGRRWCLMLALGSFGLLILSFALSVGVDTGLYELPLIFKVGPVLFAGIVTALLCGAYNAHRATPAGRRASLAYQRDHAYAPDAGHQVALRGLRAVPEPELRTQLIAAARMPRPVTTHSSGSSATDAAMLATLHWCAGTPGNGGGCGGAPGGTGGGGGGTDSGFGVGSCSASACSGGSGGSSGSSGSSCGGSSSGSSGGGSSCSSSSGSSCSSSSS